MSKRLILLLVCLMVFLYLPVNAFANGSYIVSGNGYYFFEGGERGSMGLHVNSVTLEGSLRYHYPDMNLKSTSITGLTVEGDTATITGEATVEWTSGYTFTATIVDSFPEDKMGLEIYNPDGSLYFQVETRKLLKGDFTISAQ